MKHSVIFSSMAVIVLSANAVQAKSSNEIEKISRSVSVKITNQLDKKTGSGFILHRQGDVYTIVTNRHVACVKRGEFCASPAPQVVFTIITADGQKQQVLANKVKILGQDLDLAIMQFRSPQNYPVAKLDTSTALKTGEMVYVGGFPAEEAKFRFSEGQSLATVKKRLPKDNGGYTIVYDAFTLPGMSGSSVFNQAGQVVAIHGQGDRFQEKTDATTTDFGGAGLKLGTNRGIPVNHLIKEIKKFGIDLGQEKPPSINSKSTAEEYLVTGYNQWINSQNDDDKRTAIKLYSKSIALDPMQAKAYMLRGYTYSQLGEVNKALSDYDMAIKIDPKFANAYHVRGALKRAKFKDNKGALADYNQSIILNPKILSYYIDRSSVRRNLGDLNGALSDCNRAIELEPQGFIGYVARSSVRLEMKDFREALADIEQAIQLNRNFAPSYILRGAIKEAGSQDSSGALADYNRAIELNPKYAQAYAIRGNLKLNSNDIQGALDDYDQAIKFDPRDGDVYMSRAVLKQTKLQDQAGAIADLNQAIQVDPNNVTAYFIRGVFKKNFWQDRAGAIQDLQQAARLYREQGLKNDTLATLIQSQLQELGVSE
jgi:tetratricopeptide (TPR) repeat protein